MTLARALLCAASVAAAGCAHGPSSAAELRGTAFLAPLNLSPVGTRPYSLPSLQGKVVLVNFFATWCFPCLGEMPVLNQLQQRYAEQGFTVVAVGMDVEGWKVLDPFARMFNYAFPVVVADERLRSGQTPFGRIAALPTSFLLGRDGAVVAAYQGLADKKDLVSYIEKSLRDSE